jgi:hypothetical protein
MKIPSFHCNNGHPRIDFDEGECLWCHDRRQIDSLNEKVGSLKQQLAEANRIRTREVLFTRGQALAYMKVGRRTFGRYIEAGWIGSKQFYTETELLALKDRINRERGKAWTERFTVHAAEAA